MCLLSPNVQLPPTTPSVALFIIICFGLVNTNAVADSFDHDNDGIPDSLEGVKNQNYIRNGSFEVNSALPSGYNQFHLVSDWSTYTNEDTGGIPGGIPSVADYYIESLTYQFDGAIPAHLLPLPNGDSFAGIIVRDEVAGIDGHVEHLGQFLAEPLKAGTNYVLRMSVSTWTMFVDSSITFAGDTTVDLVLYGFSNILTEPTSALVATTGSIEGYPGVKLLGEVRQPLLIADAWQQIIVAFTPDEDINFISLSARSTTIETAEATSLGAYITFDDISIFETADTDADGIADFLDLDSDNDGISDLFESGNINIVQLDINNDGTLSSLEVGALANNGLTSTALGHTPLDSDDDGIADFVDLDADNDRIPDTVEARRTLPYVSHDANSSRLDLDRDGVVALFDDNDAAGSAFGGSFVAPIDSDQDNIPDYLDTDSDQDTVNDVEESGLPAAIDANGDGIADSINASYSDPDGIINTPSEILRNEGGNTDEVGYRESTDDDADGIADAQDSNSNDSCIPNLKASRCDSDGDGIDYAGEMSLGTNPNNADSDGDGISDAIEQGDTDGDGVINALDLDSDNDGFPDALEGLSDTNNNGIPDYIDASKNDKRIGGGGAIDLFSLVILSLISLFIQMQRTNMKWKLARVFSFILIALSSAGAYADQHCFDGMNSDCMYMGAGLGYSYMSPDNSSNGFVLDSQDNNDVGYHFFLGRNFTSSWFGEIRYSYLGKTRVLHKNPSISAQYPDAGITHKIPAILLGYKFLPNSSIRPYIVAGPSAVIQSASGPIFVEKHSYFQLIMGAGLKYKSQKSKWGFHSEANWYGSDLFYLAIGAELHF